MDDKQRSALKQALLDRQALLESLPPEEAKALAIKNLIACGFLDKDGNEIPFDQEEFDNSQHPINFRKMINGH